MATRASYKICLFVGFGFSSVVSAQLWSSVDIFTKAEVRFRAHVSRDHNCLEKFEIFYREKEIRVPKEARANICNILLEDTKIEPDETAINMNSISPGFKLTLATLPPTKPDEIVEDRSLVKYEYSFDENCLTMRRIVRWDKARKAHVYTPAGAWTCEPAH